MNFKPFRTFLFLIVIGLVSCDRPECTNDNPIFDNHQPNSKVYKDELVNQLDKVDPSQLTYWLQKYDEQDGVESLYFNIQGDGLCAILHLTVNEWNRLENVRERKGVGRRGAEFTNLKFNTVQDSLNTEFIYVSYEKLID